VFIYNFIIFGETHREIVIDLKSAQQIFCKKIIYYLSRTHFIKVKKNLFITIIFC